MCMKVEMCWSSVSEALVAQILPELLADKLIYPECREMSRVRMHIVESTTSITLTTSPILITPILSLSRHMPLLRVTGIFIVYRPMVQDSAFVEYNWRKTCDSDDQRFLSHRFCSKKDTRYSGIAWWSSYVTYIVGDDAFSAVFS